MKQFLPTVQSEPGFNAPIELKKLKNGSLLILFLRLIEDALR